MMERFLVHGRLIPLLTPDLLENEGFDELTFIDAMDTSEAYSPVSANGEAEFRDGDKYVYPPSSSVNRYLGRRQITT